MKKRNLWKQKKKFQMQHNLHIPSFLDEEGIIRATGTRGKNCRISMENFQYCYIGNIIWLIYSCKTSTRTINTRAQSMYGTYFSKKCESLAYETPYEQLRYLQKNRVQTITPVMTDSPKEQLKNSTVFTNVGVDYLGPVTTRIEKRNGVRWFCLSKCLTMRAARLGLVSKLDNDCCLIAIKQFLARRGEPRVIFCWSGKCIGKTYCGTEQTREGRPSNSTGNQTEVEPPAALQFGGVWEWLFRGWNQRM